MTLLWSIIFLMIGMVFGSFFNVVGLRMPQREDFVKEQSICPHCLQTLSWLELIPVLSFVLQKGQCRSCGSSIFILYPLIELTTGVLFSYAYIKVGIEPELILALLLVSLSMILIVTDLCYMIIPDRILAFFLPLLTIAVMIAPLDPWHDAIAGALSGFLLIGSVILITKGGMGVGDMKLLALLGVVLGFKKIVLTFFIAVSVGTVIGIYLIVAKKVSRKQPIPFAPYLLTGAMISYFYGTELLLIYERLIGEHFSF